MIQENWSYSQPELCHVSCNILNTADNPINYSSIRFGIKEDRFPSWNIDTVGAVSNRAREA
jgi:hypothetical protein